MKESISYAFLLNIIITFIFICAAVIMGIFSYYRAFKANTIVLNSIEKYEGYNCLSKQEAAIKLGNISYITPFKANCKTDNNGELQTCTREDETIGYSVVHYDLGDRKYQYGVFTYMYIDLPVVNQILKIPVYAKTNIMYEFRNLVGGVDTRELEQIYAGGLEITESNMAVVIAESSTQLLSYKDQYQNTENARIKALSDFNTDGKVDTKDSTYLSKSLQKKRECGFVRDYSVLGGY